MNKWLNSTHEYLKNGVAFRTVPRPQLEYDKVNKRGAEDRAKQATYLLTKVTVCDSAAARAMIEMNEIALRKNISIVVE